MCLHGYLISVNFLAPPPPSNVGLTDISATSITVEWDQVGLATGYEVIFTPEEGECESVSGGSTVLESGTVTSHTLQNLEEFIRYSVMVRSQGREGSADFSEPELATTNAAGRSV